MGGAGKEQRTRKKGGENEASVRGKGRRPAPGARRVSKGSDLGDERDVGADAERVAAEDERCVDPGARDEQRSDVPASERAGARGVSSRFGSARATRRGQAADRDARARVGGGDREAQQPHVRVDDELEPEEQPARRHRQRALVAAPAHREQQAARAVAVQHLVPVLELPRVPRLPRPEAREERARVRGRGAALRGSVESHGGRARERDLGLEHDDRVVVERRAREREHERDEGAPHRVRPAASTRPTSLLQRSQRI